MKALGKELNKRKENLNNTLQIYHRQTDYEEVY
jgi:hypothetical protein